MIGLSKGEAGVVNSSGSASSCFAGFCGVVFGFLVVGLLVFGFWVVVGFFVVVVGLVVVFSVGSAGSGLGGGVASSEDSVLGVVASSDGVVGSVSLIFMGVGLENGGLSVTGDNKSTVSSGSGTVHVRLCLGYGILSFTTVVQ